MEQNITTLDLPKTKINKLQNLGKNYCSDLSEDLLNSLSICLPKPPRTKTGLEILEEELLNGCILSFNTDLDQVLIDEVTPTRITELAGYPGSGKTQICFQLCITVQLPKSIGGLNGEVIYINTNKNFASHRLRELSQKIIQLCILNCNLSKDESKDFTEESILSHIYVFNCDDMLEFHAAVQYVEAVVKNKKVKLLIIDSISNLIRELDPKDRTATIYKLLGQLQSLAIIFNFATVITNDFTTRVKDNEAYFTPSFGGSFFDRINSRICLSKNEDVYFAELVKSVVKVPKKVSFYMF